MTLGEHYSQLRNDLEMAESLYDRWNTDEIVDYIMQDYAEVSITVLEKLLEAQPELWEIVNSLE